MCGWPVSRTLPRTCGKGSKPLCGLVTGWNVLDNGLCCCALLCTATGRYAEAATVWAAQDHAHPGSRGSWTSALGGARRRDEALSKTRQALGPDRARTAEQRGAAMSVDTAAEYALMLTAPGPLSAAAAGPGLGKLSARERELVTLVAQGRTEAPDRRAAVHQRPHGRLTPGPDPRQDRLPPPRRPDPPGPDRGPGLTLNLAAARRESGHRACGSSDPWPPPSAQGVSRPLPGACPRARAYGGQGRESRPDPSRQEHDNDHAASRPRPRPGTGDPPGWRTPWLARRPPGRRHLRPAGISRRRTCRLRAADTDRRRRRDHLRGAGQKR